MTDIVERLEAIAEEGTGRIADARYFGTVTEAADIIERLTRERDDLTLLVAREQEWRREAERERDEARANYQWMVEHVADEKLDGYRELGVRAAAAENAAAALRAEVERLRNRLTPCPTCGTLDRYPATYSADGHAEPEVCKGCGAALDREDDDV